MLEIKNDRGTLMGKIHQEADQTWTAISLHTDDFLGGFRLRSTAEFWLSLIDDRVRASAIRGR